MKTRVSTMLWHENLSTMSWHSTPRRGNCPQIRPTQQYIGLIKINKTENKESLPQQRFKKASCEVTQSQIRLIFNGLLDVFLQKDSKNT